MEIFKSMFRTTEEGYSLEVITNVWADGTISFNLFITELSSQGQFRIELRDHEMVALSDSVNSALAVPEIFLKYNHFNNNLKKMVELDEKDHQTQSFKNNIHNTNEPQPIECSIEDLKNIESLTSSWEFKADLREIFNKEGYSPIHKNTLIRGIQSVYGYIHYKMMNMLLNRCIDNDLIKIAHSDFYELGQEIKTEYNWYSVGFAYKKLYDTLPVEFTIAQFVDKASQVHITEATSKKWLTKECKASSLFKKTGYGKYKKIYKII